jgi:hypothetical protein
LKTVADLSMSMMDALGKLKRTFPGPLPTRLIWLRLKAKFLS